MSKNPVDAAALAEEGRAAERYGEPHTALRCYEHAARLLEGSGDTLLADVTRWMGTVHRELGNTGEAERLYRRSLKLADEAEYPRARAHALNCLALLAHRRGDIAEARTLYAEAAHLAERCRDGRLTAMVQHNLGILADVRGDSAEALRCCRLALDAFQEERDDGGMCEVLNTLGLVHTRRGAWNHAEAAFSEGLELARRRGSRHFEGILETNLAATRIAAGRLEQAEEPLERALAVAAKRRDPGRTAEALKTRAILYDRRGRTTEAELDLARARTLAESAADALLLAEVMRVSGEISAKAGRAEFARQALDQALRGFTGIGAEVDAAAVEEELTALAA
ncbi:MAG TPA: tetratricopeptide repeat protein [Longimicrobiaceae bacterium]